MLNLFSNFIKKEDDNATTPQNEVQARPFVSNFQHLRQEKWALDTKELTEVKGGGVHKSFSESGFSWNATCGELMKQ